MVATVDVHGLLVKEAIKIVEKKLGEVMKRGDESLRVIVGKGKHSKDGKAKLRPAILEHFLKYVILPFVGGTLLMVF